MSLGTWLTIVGLVGGPLVSAFIGLTIGTGRGHSPAVSFFSGLLLPVVGWVLLIIIPSGPTRECPYCAEYIREKAVVCRYCHKDIPPHVD